MPRRPKVTQENKPIISINLLRGILLIRLKLFGGLQSGKCWKLEREDPWLVLGFSRGSEPWHVSCRVPVAPGQERGDARPHRVCVEAANTLPAFSLFLPVSVSVPVPCQEGCWEVSCHGGPAGPLCRAGGATAPAPEGRRNPGELLSSPDWMGWFL